MIGVSFWKVRPEQAERLRLWLDGLNGRQDEVLPTLRLDGVVHEHAYLLAGPDGPVMVLASEADDIEEARQHSRTSELPFDVEARRMMEETCAGRAEADLLWQGTAASVPEASPGPPTSPVALVEFPADDVTRARRFWATVLGLRLEVRAAGEGRGWQTPGGGSAIGLHERGTGPGDRFSLPYFRVADLPSALERVSASGGEVIHPGARWAICRDSEGSPFGLAVEEDRGPQAGDPEGSRARRSGRRPYHGDEVEGY